MAHGSDMEGRECSEEEAAKGLGFKDVEEFRAWQLDGSPLARCSNARCWRPVSYPFPACCPHCGEFLRISRKGSCP